MDLHTIFMILEGFVFWAIVIMIAIWGRNAPTWAFGFLFYYILYLIVRFILAKQGIDRIMYLNILNIVVLLSLFIWYSRQ